TALRELYEAVAKVEAGAAPAFAHRVFQAAAIMQLPVAVPAETIERGGLVIGDQTGITATLFGMCQEIEGAGVVAAIERGYALAEQFAEGQRFSVRRGIGAAAASGDLLKRFLLQSRDNAFPLIFKITVLEQNRLSGRGFTDAGSVNRDPLLPGPLDGWRPIAVASRIIAIGKKDNVLVAVQPHILVLQCRSEAFSDTRAGCA